MRKIPYGKKLALAVLILAAGCFCSCGAEGRGEYLSGEQTEESLIQDPPLQRQAQDGEKEDASEAEEEPPCFVYVCGEVMEPGVYELKAGQRIFEAIAMAGGFTERAARSYLNLAEPVWDGMKLEVPDRDQVPSTEWRASAGQTGSGSASAGADAVGRVNLNTATKEELMTLRGIGEARAEDIIRYRQERGGFDRIEDIMEVSGIKNAAFEKIKDDITV